MKPLAPYTRQFLASPPPSGLWVACGPSAWSLAKQKSFTVLVLPQENEPCDFRWPGHEGGAIAHETGNPDDDRLAGLATELLAAGCPFVVALRESLMTSDPRHFFYPEARCARP